MCVSETERETGREGVCERDRERWGGRVCVRETEREMGREGV